MRERVEPPVSQENRDERPWGTGALTMRHPSIRKSWHENSPTGAGRSVAIPWKRSNLLQNTSVNLQSRLGRKNCVFWGVTPCGSFKNHLQEPHGVTSQKTQFFIVTAVKTSNLTRLGRLLLQFRGSVENSWHPSRSRIYQLPCKSGHCNLMPFQRE
jgi:hypothetical protein